MMNYNDINNYIWIIKQEWITANSSFPDFLIEIPPLTKENNENYIQTITEQLHKQMKVPSRSIFRRKKWKQKTLHMFKDLLINETVIGIHKAIDQPTLEAYQEEITDFLKQVRNFAPELTIEEIGQAIRNYLVYVMFKELNSRKPGFNKACFGYSLLYPFTDNYIDSRQYTNEDKIRYNQMIRDKIKGSQVHPTTMHQHKTCELLHAIEAEYPREKNSAIFLLLQKMLEAQEGSMRQQSKEIDLSMDERLDISLIKGGISVLIDGYFVNNDLTQQDSIFYLSLGFFLQLADDLQDIQEDSVKGNQTIFTVDISENKDYLVNKMLHFIHHVMENCLMKNEQFKAFILYNCYQLVYFSIIRSKVFFSKDYLNKLEKYFIVSYHFFDDIIKNLNNIDRKTHVQYIKILDELVL